MICLQICILECILLTSTQCIWSTVEMKGVWRQRWGSPGQAHIFGAHIHECGKSLQFEEMIIFQRIKDRRGMNSDGWYSQSTGFSSWHLIKPFCWRSSYTWPFYFNPACQIVYFSRGRAGWKIKEQLWNLHFCYWERRYSIKLRAVLCADFLLGWFSSDLLESTTLPLCWGVVLPWEVKPSKT